ncbi:Integrator complex subunit 3 [Thelohanellus kitauei]|uniref:Integrator complex subunit 3 n=1 Tax=Thelohanellus kitauei TaxID=669202 RepID=A0A0C2MDG8_THEKT|nr:Integrator complex subunit 3 [Thelohanellus kitauei]
MICAEIGRDLVRCFQMIGRTKPLDIFWSKLNDCEGSGYFSEADLAKIIRQPTHPQLLACRLPYKIANKINFLSTQSGTSDEVRYQSWILRDFVDPANQELIPDAIRYILSLNIPKNPSVIPRWVLVRLLLSAVQQEITRTNAKMAIFYDWMFCSVAEPHMLSIECGMNLIMNSNKTHQQFTASLVEFLYLISKNKIFDTLVDVQESINIAFRISIQKGLIESMEFLSRNPIFTIGFLSDFRECFPDAFIPEGPKGFEQNEFETSFEPNISHNFIQDVGSGLNTDVDTETESELDIGHDACELDHSCDSDETSDEMSDFPIPQSKNLENSHELNLLPSNLRVFVRQLDVSQTVDTRCLAMREVLNVLANIPLPPEIVTNLVSCLAIIFTEELSLSCSEEKSDDSYDIII